MSEQEKLEDSIFDTMTVLSYIIDELKTTYKILELYEKRMLSTEPYPEKEIPKKDYMLMMFNYIILSLWKYLELYEKKKPLLNEKKDPLPKKLYDQLNKLQIKELRNKYIGHAFDKDTKRPISYEKFISYIEKIEDEHLSLQTFIMKIRDCPFIDEMPIITILETIKNNFNDESTSS